MVDYIIENGYIVRIVFDNGTQYFEAHIPVEDLSNIGISYARIKSTGTIDESSIRVYDPESTNASYYQLDGTLVEVPAAEDASAVIPEHAEPTVWDFENSGVTLELYNGTSVEEITTKGIAFGTSDTGMSVVGTLSADGSIGSGTVLRLSVYPGDVLKWSYEGASEQTRTIVNPETDGKLTASGDTKIIKISVNESNGSKGK